MSKTEYQTMDRILRCQLRSDLSGVRVAFARRSRGAHFRGTVGEALRDCQNEVALLDWTCVSA